MPPRKGSAAARRAGRRPVPKATLELRGTLRSERIAEMPDLPPAVAPLPAHVAAIPEAAEEWRRLAPILEAARVVSETDAQIFAQYCITHAAVVAASRRLAEEGFFLNGSLNPAFGAYEKAAQMNQRQMIELGLTPSARRSLIRLPEPGAARALPGKSNPFEEKT